MEKKNFKIPILEEKVGLPKIPEGAEYIYEVSGPEDTIKCVFSDGAWWATGDIIEKKIDKNKQQEITEEYNKQHKKVLNQIK